MKLTALFLLIIIFKNTEAQIKPFVPYEYEYPKAVLSAPKTYVYKSPSNKEVRYKDVSRTDAPGKVIISWKQYYSANHVIDSSIEINDKVVESYIFLRGQRIKETMSEDSVHNDGSKFGEKVQSASFNANSISFSTLIKSRFLKDTVFTWKSKELPCIVIESNATLVFHNPTDSSQTKENSAKFFIYFCKGVGNVRFTQITDEGVEIWDLDEIKEIKN
jgi:hypothetical protein